MCIVKLAMWIPLVIDNVLASDGPLGHDGADNPCWSVLHAGRK